MSVITKMEQTHIDELAGTMVVEGARTAQAAYQRSLELNIEVPIIEEVYKVIYNHKSVKKAVNDLMSRNLKKE